MQVGNAVRVVAVDAASGLEVTIMGPLSESQETLQRIAYQKLQARLAREQ